MIFEEWARDWGVPVAAVQDYRRRLMGPNVDHVDDGKGESYVQSQIRLSLAQQGCLVWRNNVGALQDSEGRFVRYGLANDSKQLNEHVKSGDLILGIPRAVTADMLGKTILQLGSVEAKEQGWKFTGAGRESAQMNWADLINANGGFARFATGPFSVS